MREGAPVEQSTTCSRRRGGSIINLQPFAVALGHKSAFRFHFCSRRGRVAIDHGSIGAIGGSGGGGGGGGGSQRAQVRLA
jgi:hypothetical protein